MTATPEEGAVRPPASRGKVTLFQQRLRREPFWMMVACVMVNRATWLVAQAVHSEVRRRWPTVRTLSRAHRAALTATLRPLGFQRQRAGRLVALARAWLDRGRPRDAADAATYPGLGRYASDSWAIFMDGRTDVEPTDGWLALYLKGEKRCRSTE